MELTEPIPAADKQKRSNLPDAEILDTVLKIYRKEKKTQSWPVHIVAQAAMIGFASGEVTRRSLEIKYEVDNQADGEDAVRIMKNHAYLTIVNAIRFLENLK